MASSRFRQTVGLPPRFIQKNTNAVLDAEQFENSTGPGGLEVGSNPSEARNLIDGDLDTSWGPDPDSPLEKLAFHPALGPDCRRLENRLALCRRRRGGSFSPVQGSGLAPGDPRGPGIGPTPWWERISRTSGKSAGPTNPTSSKESSNSSSSPPNPRMSCSPGIRSKRCG